jgi:hypothetical protein
MALIPRSLRSPAPYRGRALRYFVDKVPGLRAWRLWAEDVRRRRIAVRGRRFLESGRKEGRRFLTAIPNQFCGIGHSSTEWNTAYQWAPRLGLEFVDTRMAEPWASFLGFGATARKWTEVLRTERPVIVRLPYVTWGAGIDSCAFLQPVVDAIHSHRNLLFVLADGQNCYDHTANAARQQSDFLVHGRWQHLPEHREPGRLNVAVHIRRGDVVAMKSRGQGNWQQRFVGADWFANVMLRVLEEHRDERPLFHLYSQGGAEEFADLGSRFELRLHLDAGEQECLLNMSRADVLVMSPSGFSYLAAILSRGRKIARVPWWHHLPQGTDWTLLSADPGCSSGG